MAFLAALQAVIERVMTFCGRRWCGKGLREPVQVVWRQAALPVEEVELDPAGGDGAEQLRARFDARRYRLDIRQAPLMRAYSSARRSEEPLAAAACCTTIW